MEQKFAAHFQATSTLVFISRAKQIYRPPISKHINKGSDFMLKSISFKNNLKNSEMSKIYMILPRSILIVLICTTTYKAVFLRVHYHYLTVLLVKYSKNCIALWNTRFWNTFAEDRSFCCINKLNSGISKARSWNTFCVNFLKT